MSFDYDRPEPRRGVMRLSPSGGWFALGLVAAMCVALAWSLDDAVLVLGTAASRTSWSGRRWPACWSGSWGRPWAGAAGRPT